MSGFVINPYVSGGSGPVPPSDWSNWDGTLDGAVTLIDARAQFPSGTNVVKLSTDKLLVTYYSPYGSVYFGSVLTVTGTTMTVGTSVVIGSFPTGEGPSSVDVLDSGRVVFIYQGISSRGQAVVLSISGTTITVGTPIFLTDITAIPPTFASALRVKKIDTDKLIYTFAVTTDGGINRNACGILLVSGTSISIAGTAGIFAIATDIGLAVLDSTHIVVSYTDNSDSSGRARVALVTGNDVTFPSAAVQFDSATVSSVTACAMASDQAVTAYVRTTDTNRLSACVLNISGTVITAQTPVLFGVIGRITTVGAGICAISSTQFMVNYSRTAAFQGVPGGIVGTIAANIITFSTPVVIDPAGEDREGNANAVIDGVRIMFVYTVNGGVYGTVLRAI